MGVMIHHAIAVTSWSEEQLGFARDMAIRLGCAVTNMSAEQVNGYRTFFVIPDGSKEGWTESDEGEARRKNFKGWLEATADECGDQLYEWVEVAYGPDIESDKGAYVTSSAWMEVTDET